MKRREIPCLKNNTAPPPPTEAVTPAESSPALSPGFPLAPGGNCCLLRLGLGDGKEPTGLLALEAWVSTSLASVFESLNATPPVGALRFLAQMLLKSVPFRSSWSSFLQEKAGVLKIPRCVNETVITHHSKAEDWSNFRKKMSKICSSKGLSLGGNR